MIYRPFDSELDEGGEFDTGVPFTSVAFEVVDRTLVFIDKVDPEASQAVLDEIIDEFIEL